MKGRWEVSLEEVIRELREISAARRDVSLTDPAGDGLDFAAARIEAVLIAHRNPSTLLTPEQWAAEQDNPPSPATVRRWCRAGELECDVGPRGYLIPAHAQRKGPVVAVVELAS